MPTFPSTFPKSLMARPCPHNSLPSWATVVKRWGFGDFPAQILYPAACMIIVGALSVAGQEIPLVLPLLPAPPPRPGTRGASARSQAQGHGFPGAGRGSAAGANPPRRRPARHLAGHPSKTVRHRFPVGSPLRQTNPGSLNLPGKSPAGRRAGGKEGAAAGLRRPGGEAGAITTLSFFRLILTSHFNLIEPCLASRLLAPCEGIRAGRSREVIASQRRWPRILRAPRRLPRALGRPGSPPARRSPGQGSTAWRRLPRSLLPGRSCCPCHVPAHR